MNARWLLTRGLLFCRALSSTLTLVAAQDNRRTRGGLQLGAALVLSLTPALPRADVEWTDAGTKQGVALAYRDDARLDAREVRAIAELPFPAAKIASVVCDLSQYKELVPGVSEANVLDGRVPGDYEIYLRYAPRFLVVAARDVVVRVTSGPPLRPDPGGEEAAETHGCRWSEVAARTPERQGTVRMPLLRGSWAVEALDAERSRVVYQVAVKPGGRIPGWLVRRGAAQALPEVIDKVRERLQSLNVRLDNRPDGAASPRSPRSPQ